MYFSCFWIKSLSELVVVVGWSLRCRHGSQPEGVGGSPPEVLPDWKRCPATSRLPRPTRNVVLVTCSLTTLKPFSLSLEKVGTIPIVEGPLAVSANAGSPGPRNPRSSCRFARLARVSFNPNWPTSSTRELCLPRYQEMTSFS